MANKRTLKRSINLITEELLIDYVAASLYGNEKHLDNAEALFFAIVRMQDDFVRRISHPEPGMPPKRYYKKLREQYASQVGELLDQINNL